MSVEGLDNHSFSLHGTVGAVLRLNLEHDRASANVEVLLTLVHKLVRQERAERGATIAMSVDRKMHFGARVWQV